MGQDQGVLEVVGPVKTFSVGGQELWIDQVCLREVEPPAELDWGDAPDSPYPTTRLSGGAFHAVSRNVMLGRLVDAERDGQPTTLADGDDLNPPKLDDEDGVTFLAPLSPGGTARATVVASTAGWLNAWVDFNRDGTWDAREQIFTGEPLAAGVNNLAFDVPASALPNPKTPTFSRWRFSTSHKLLGPTGGATPNDPDTAPNGEVEDHAVAIIRQDPLDCIDFEGLPSGTQYHVGDTFVADTVGLQATFTGSSFVFGNGGVFNGGYAQVDTRNLSGGSGQDLWTNNIVLSATFASPLPGLRMNFGEYGGNLNVEINGERVNVEDFRDIDGAAIGGVLVRVLSGGGGNDQGVVQLGGVIDTFAIGGQELWIDQFCIDADAERLGLDFGDAPDRPYPTTLGHRGAWHVIRPKFFLGETVDVDSDGQPTGMADGDDLLDGVDDEDGVTFPSPLVPGEATRIRVVASQSGALDAWIDFDADGVWEPTDQIALAVPLSAGVNFVSVTVPPWAVPGDGTSMARFRLSLQGGLAPTGYGGVGEVEDYPVTISERTPPAIPDPVVKLGLSTLTRLGGSVQFPEAQFVAVDDGGQQWIQMISPGSESVLGPIGMPGVPIYRRLIAVPRGATPSVRLTAPPEVVRSMSVDLYPFQDTGLDESPKPPDSFFDDPPEFQIDKRAYQSDARFPEQVVNVVPLGRLRDLDVAIVEIATGQYNPVAKRLDLFGKVDWEVGFEGGEKGFLPAEALNPFENAEPVYQAVLNHDVLERFPIPGTLVPVNFGEELLILTHPDFRTAADKLASWKRSKGIMTSVFEVGAGTQHDTPAEIHDFIKSRWETNIVRPSYLLLLGDTEFIPTNYRSTAYSSTTATDVPYTYVAGGLFNILPDMANGRIPVDTASQAMDVVDKIIDYEQTPPGTFQDGSFYQNASVVSQFQGYRNGSPSGRDQRAFVEASERARTTLIGAGKTIERIYTKTENTSSPEPNRYYNGDLLPPDLRIGSGFAWDGDGQDVTDAFNDGRFLIVHRDHGWPLGWVNPEFTTSDVNTLANGDLTPVVYSINCASGFFDNETANGEKGTTTSGVYFAEQLLRKGNGGAVGIIGDTRDSNTWSNTAFLRGLIDATWQNNDPSYGGTISTRRLGDIMNYAKTYTITQIGVAGTTPEVEANYAVDTLFLYHVFGDPTLEMWTRNPHTIVLPLDYAYDLPALRQLDFQYATDGAVVTAFQEDGDNLIPLGRGVVQGGKAELPLVTDAMPGMPIQFAVTMDNGVSQLLAPSVPGDFNDDRAVDQVDIDRLCSTIHSGQATGEFDLNADGTVDFADREYLVRQILGTDYGDANLDRTFDSTDLLLLFQRGEYEDRLPNNSGWADGDFNCDGDFDSADLLLALQTGTYERGPMAVSIASMSPSATADGQIAAAVDVALSDLISDESESLSGSADDGSESSARSFVEPVATTRLRVLNEDLAVVDLFASHDRRDDASQFDLLLGPLEESLLEALSLV